MSTTGQPTGPGHHRVAGFLTLLGGVVLAGGVVIGLTAGVGAVWTAVTSSGTASAATATTQPGSVGAVSHAAKAPAATVQKIKLVVDPPPLYGVQVAGQVHDAFVPGTFTMKAGVTYQVTVLNYDAMPHTWTSPALGVNASIPTGSESSPSTTTFTIHPTKAGTFPWYCATPCDQWSMVHNGYMRGLVKVTA